MASSVYDGIDLSDQVAWITGGGSGIGLAAAEALARAGAKVVITGRRLAQLEAARQQILDAGGVGADQVHIESLDVGDLASVDAAARRIEAAHGPVTILVNSAGINVPGRSWKEISALDFARVIQINLNGAMAACSAVLPGMRKAGGGLIINVSSWAGRYDTQFTGAAYNASKHGLLALTATINMEEGGHGIRACALCPGEVATPILKSRPVPPSKEEMERMLKPEDLGRTILFLAALPAHVCVNELVISPTHNRIYAGFAPAKAAPTVPIAAAEL